MYSDRLNARYRSGRPSSSLSGAGVLIHQLDRLENDNKPWLPCTEKWCVKMSDRWAASIINKDLRYLYFAQVGGFVIAPSTISLFCAYSSDGDSQSKVCSQIYGDGHSCIPGCYPKGQDCITVGHEYTCSFPPENLYDAMMAQMARQARDKTHNEVVIDIRTVAGSLPTSIEAMFYQTTSSDVEIAQIRTAHELFLHEYPTAHTKILILDRAGGKDGVSPFSPDDGRLTNDNAVEDEIDCVDDPDCDCTGDPECEDDWDILELD